MTGPTPAPERLWPLFDRRRLRVYIAGPISTGDPFENVHSALRVGRRMVGDGLAPFIPHLDAFLLSTDCISWEEFLEWDLEYVATSDAVYRLAGDSRGADVEVEHAEALGIPVFHESINDVGYFALLAHALGRRLLHPRTAETRRNS